MLLSYDFLPIVHIYNIILIFINLRFARLILELGAQKTLEWLE